LLTIPKEGAIMQQRLARVNPPQENIQAPRGTVHSFRNAGSTVARVLVFCAPAGLEKYFEEVFEPVRDRSASPPPTTDALVARLLAAAPKYGLEYV
jgi:hypothetical protein